MLKTAKKTLTRHMIATSGECGKFHVHSPFDFSCFLAHPVFSLSVRDGRLLSMYDELEKNSVFLRELFLDTPILRCPAPFEQHGIQLVVFPELSFLFFALLELDCSLRSFNFFFYSVPPTPIVEPMNHLIQTFTLQVSSVLPRLLPLHSFPLFVTIPVHPLEYCFLELERTIVASLANI